MQAIPSPEELEASGAVIGEIRIVIGDVFDTSVEGESGWLYRTANKLHINTRESVVRDQLLFKPGQPYRHRVVLETERLLRANDGFARRTQRSIGRLSSIQAPLFASRSILQPPLSRLTTIVTARVGVGISVGTIVGVGSTRVHLLPVPSS